MKILVLTHEYPPIGGGGGMVAKDLAVGLAGKGHKVMILTTKIPNIPPDSSSDRVKVKRVETFRKRAFKASFVDMALYDLAVLWHGARIIKKWKPDLIHAHFAVPAGAVARILSRWFGIPYLLTAHLGDVPGAVPSKTDQWFRWILPFTHVIWRDAAVVVAVSEFTRNLAHKLYPVPIQVIHNGIGIDKINTPTIDAGANRPVQLIFAARFAEQKNPSHLVQALAPLKELDWQCNMLGDGPLYDEVRKMVRNLGLEDKFNFAGWVTPEQVVAAFAENDILVLPSSSEGLSVVGVQALAMGLVWRRVLCCGVLSCAVLCCAALRCAVPCCAVVWCDEGCRRRPSRRRPPAPPRRRRPPPAPRPRCRWHRCPAAPPRC